MLFDYGALRKSKKNFIFEDLAYFHGLGWQIKYFGLKSKKLPSLGAEYLGEEDPREKKKKK
jgi:hypothetical protein